MTDEATRIRVIIAMLDVTTKDFADMVGVNANSVTSWRNGHHIPQAGPRRAIAEIMKKHNIAIRPDGFPVPVESTDGA